MRATGSGLKCQPLYFCLHVFASVKVWQARFSSFLLRLGSQGLFGWMAGHPLCYTPCGATEVDLCIHKCFHETQGDGIFLHARQNPRIYLPLESDTQAPPTTGGLSALWRGGEVETSLMQVSQSCTWAREGRRKAAPHRGSFTEVYCPHNWSRLRPLSESHPVSREEPMQHGSSLFAIWSSRGRALLVPLCSCH